MRTTFIPALLAALVLATSADVAITDDKHGHQHEHKHHHDEAKDGDHGPKHGGQFVEDPNHHGIELVASEKGLVFHITEHHEPVDLTGSEFKVVIQAEGGTGIQVPTIDGTTLKVDLENVLAKGTKVVLTGKDGHGDTIQARFVIN